MKNFLFFGLGSIGQRHARILREIYLDNANIYAVRALGSKLFISDDLKIKDGRNFIQDLGIKEIALEEIDQINFDLAFICNPTSLHYFYVNLMADKKINFFCEKPLCEKEDLLNKLSEKIISNNIFTHIGYNLQFSKACIEFNALFNKSKTDLISVSFVSAEYMPSWHQYEDYTTSYAARNSLGGGALKTLCHEFQIVTSLFDHVEVCSKYLDKVSNLNIDTNDHVDLIMIGYIGDKKVPIRGHLNFYAREASRTITLQTTHEKIILDNARNSVSRRNDSHRLETIFGGTRNETFKAQMQYLIECIESKNQSFLSANALVEFHALLEAINNA